MKKNRIVRSKVINAFALGLVLLSFQVNLMRSGDAMRLDEFLEIAATFIQLVHVLDVLP